MNTENMEMAYECNASADIKVKGDIANLPKVKKAIIGRADVNSYGTAKNGRKGEMVGNKYQILVILREDFGGIKAGERTTANAVLFAAGVKTLPFFSDFEKAKAACKKVERWGKVTEKKEKKTKTVAEKVAAKVSKMSEQEKQAMIAALMAE
jgi:uncharacterized protein YjbJ (UPF0337 family)